MGFVPVCRASSRTKRSEDPGSGAAQGTRNSTLSFPRRRESITANGAEAGARLSPLLATSWIWIPGSAARPRNDSVLSSKRSRSAHALRDRCHRHGHGLQCSTWIALMRSSISGVIVTSMAAMSVLSCSIEVAPMMFEVTKGRELTKAMRHLGRIEAEFPGERDVFADRRFGRRVLVALAAAEQGRARARRTGAVEILAGQVALRRAANRRAGRRSRASRPRPAPPRRCG